MILDMKIDLELKYMENTSNLDLLWEKTFGTSVGIYNAAKKIVFTPTLMKKLAISKMIDVTLISADFHEYPVVFTPLLWVMLDSFSNVEFFGVYLNDDEDTNNSTELERLPSFCIRKAFWNRQEDIENFQLADDKKKYILGEKQTLSNVIFTGSKHYIEVKQLISEIIQSVKYGLNLQEFSRSESTNDEIKINISSGVFYLDFSYHPGVLKSDMLEEWIIRFRNCIESLPLNTGYFPDTNFRMSYRLSLFDQISNFNIMIESKKKLKD
jgi:hypothetical protein